MASHPKSAHPAKAQVERKPETLAKASKAWDSGGTSTARRSNNFSAYVWAVFGILVLGYFAYSYYWPMTTTPMVIKQTTTPVAPAVTPPAAVTPSVATPPATTTTP